MSLQCKLRVFDLEEQPIATKNCLSIWCREKLFNEIKSETTLGRNEALYIQIVSRVALQEFTIYGVLDPILPKSLDADRYLENEIWVPNALFNKTILYSDNLDVEVLPIDESKQPLAEVVTIKLNKGEVEMWADDEVLFASNSFKGKNHIVFDGQMTLLKPRTKLEVFGEVTDIIPKMRNNKPYRCSHETKIVFDGLPDVKQKVIDFSKIGGLTDLINNLREIIQIPLNFPELLTKFGIKPPKGLLMYGPPGNGKTMIARAVSYSMGSKFISIQGPEYMSKYVGAAEERLRETFEEAEKIGNCVIFIDEIDSVASKRGDQSAEWQISYVSTLLNLMDGMRSNSRVFVIGATNRLNAIDPALRRPGRFDIEFEVPQPATDARYDILTKYIDVTNRDRFSSAIDDNFLHIISELTNGYSGADLNLLYRESVMNAIRKNLSFDSKTGKIQLATPTENLYVDKQDFYNSLKTIKPTSLRDADYCVSTRSWNEIYGLDDQKVRFEQIRNAVELFSNSEKSEQRLSLANVILLGKRGSGRRTIVQAFAAKYNYEVLRLNMLSISTIPIDEAFEKISETFGKAKQIAPSIVLVENADRIGKKEILFDKIVDETNALGKRFRIIVALKADDKDNLPKQLFGYKAFDNVIDFNISRESILEALSKLSIDVDVPTNDDCTIGQIITKHVEGQILNF